MLDLGLINKLLKSVFMNITCFTTFESLFLALFSWILCRLDFFQKSFASAGFVGKNFLAARLPLKTLMKFYGIYSVIIPAFFISDPQSKHLLKMAFIIQQPLPVSE